MQIQVSGTNMEVGQALTVHAQDNLEREVVKYFENAIEAHVAFSKEGPLLVKASIIVDEGVKGNKLTVKSDAVASDPYVAFSEALEKAAKQLRRYKRKLKNFRRRIPGIKSEAPNRFSIDATKYIIPNELVQQNEEIEVAESDSVKVVAEKTTDIQTLTIDDAVMSMDLANLPALVFINEETGNINVVYHRKDGNISWIDTKKSA